MSSNPRGAQERQREEYIHEVDLAGRQPKEKVISEGVQPIHNGLVIDHILRGEDPTSIRDHMRLISSVLGLDEAKGGEWVSTGGKERECFKGIIFRPGNVELSRKHLKRLGGGGSGLHPQSHQGRGGSPQVPPLPAPEDLQLRGLGVHQ